MPQTKVGEPRYGRFTLKKRDRGIPLRRALPQLYEKLDALAQAAAHELGATCMKGCAHCCYQLSTISVAEGTVIAERVLAMDDWQDVLGKLRRAAVLHQHGGPSKEAHIASLQPCAFLQGKLCSIYDVRPGCCRFHFVVSDPKNCSPVLRPGAQTLTIDLRVLEDRVLALGAELARQQKQHLTIAPIAVTVLHCLRELVRDEQQATAVREACAGIPTPTEWMALTKEDSTEVVSL